MRGELKPPAALENYLYRGFGYKKNKLVNLSKIKNVVIEVSSIKNYFFNDLILHIGYEDNIKRGEISPLKGVKLEKETSEEIVKNLKEIKSGLGDKKLIFFCQNNLAGLPIRYLLANILSQWCEENNIPFIDPTKIICLYGVEKCLKTFDENPWILNFVTLNDVKYDTEHYKKFMQNKIKDILCKI